MNGEMREQDVTGKPVPDISIVIPVLDEEQAIRTLLENLAAQREIALEVVLCDGGSGDGTVEVAEAAAASLGLPLTAVRSSGGRGRQLNDGVPAARAELLLFLHADSQFGDPLALRSGYDLLAAAGAARGFDRVAGRFALRFRRSRPGVDLGYYYYECKARLDRPGCIHGDQGLLLHRALYRAAGPFSETVPMLAETRFVEAVRSRATWLLLPAELHTSARRFESEGLTARQTLNAIIMNLDAVGQERMLAELPGLYRPPGTGGGGGPLSVLPGISRRIAAMPEAERRAFWRATGAYVKDNAWQLAFALDVRRAFRQGFPPGAEERRSLGRYDRWVHRLLDNAAGRWTAMLLTRLWFRGVVRVAVAGTGGREG